MDIKRTLESVELRVTKPRLAVFEVLTSHHQPLEVSEIKALAAKKKINMDKVTVYRILEVFVKTGLVSRIELQEGKFRYELAGHHHHHLVCDSCGSIADIEDCLPEGLEETIKQQEKFIVKRHSMEFFGLCRNCHK